MGYKRPRKFPFYYQKLLQMYCMMFISISKRKSFDNITSWVEECKNHTLKAIFLVLKGNKIDFEDQREVTKEEGQELADKFEKMLMKFSIN